MTDALIAYCGLYCGACSFKLAFEENDRAHILAMPAQYNHLKNAPLEACPGCRMENNLCKGCTMRDCAMSRNLENCSQCIEFPCLKVQAFNDDGKPHHGEVIRNLRLLKELGDEEWLAHMKRKWTCACGVKKSWYFESCTCRDQ